MTKLLPISYESIPSDENGNAAVSLMIYPPGTWFDSPGYHVLVGGCGHGSRDTLKEAEEHLLQSALSHCAHQVTEGTAVANHFTHQMRLLTYNKVVRVHR